MVVGYSAGFEEEHLRSRGGCKNGVYSMAGMVSKEWKSPWSQR